MAPVMLVFTLFVWWWMTHTLFINEGTSLVQIAIAGGAISREMIWLEPWRLFTASLTHVDSAHLFVNCALTFVFSTTLSILTRPAMALAVFITAGAIGAAAAAWLHPGWHLGASAGAFGLLGALGARLAKDPNLTGWRAFTPGLLGLVLATLAPGNLTAHLGGFTVGCLLGVASSRNAKWLVISTISAWIIGLIAFILDKINP